MGHTVEEVGISEGRKRGGRQTGREAEVREMAERKQGKNWRWRSLEGGEREKRGLEVLIELLHCFRFLVQPVDGTYGLIVQSSLKCAPMLPVKKILIISLVLTCCSCLAVEFQLHSSILPALLENLHLHPAKIDQIKKCQQIFHHCLPYIFVSLLKFNTRFAHTVIQIIPYVNTHLLNFNPGGVLGISRDRDDRRIFGGLKVSIPGFFWVGKFGKYFFD